jgi:hypothetical protein
MRDVTTEKRSTPTILIFFFWVSGLAFACYAYLAVYYSFLILPAYDKPVESVSELVNSDKRWFCYNGTQMENYAQYQPLGRRAIFRRFQDRSADFEQVKDSGGKIIAPLDR